jgi:hypothetical protein
MTVYAIEIPDIEETPYVLKTVDLNGVDYIFKYSWNTRSNSCFLTITNKESSQYIIKYQEMIGGYDLLLYTLQEDITGIMFMQDVTGNNRRPSIKDISVDFTLVYDDLQD